MIKDNVLQSLLLMKSQFSMIDSQLNNLITQTQNMGILPNTYMQINNISFQILNFGINMLNLGLQYSNPMMKYNLKYQIDNIINQLNNISFNITNNNIPNMQNMNNFPDIYSNSFSNDSKKYNIIFNRQDGLRTLIYYDGNCTIRDMINSYLIKIGRNDLIGKEDKEYDFCFNSKNINNNNIKNKKVSEVFINCSGSVPIVNVFIIKNCIGSNYLIKQIIDEQKKFN